jgi:hypothetical protein
MTLSQSFDQFLANITITDRQEKSISTTYNNLSALLRSSANGLYTIRIFLNGSYERFTIIRPLDDVDLFLVLDKDKYMKDGVLCSPQSVLTKVKNFLNGTTDYKDKVSQDRPCVTVHLSDKRFDVLPCFGDKKSGYLIPNYDLTGWITTNPETHSDRLIEVNKLRNMLVRRVIRMIKQWNLDNGKIIPSFHIEEIAISIFGYTDITSYEEGVYHWFHSANYYLFSSKFKSYEDYTKGLEKVAAAKVKVDEAHKLYGEGKETDAMKKYKEVFTTPKFPTVSVNEAKNYSEAIRTGSLRMGANGYLSTTLTNGIIVPPTRFYGGEE